MHEQDDRFYKDANLYAAEKVNLAEELVKQRDLPNPPKLLSDLQGKHLELFEAFIAGTNIAYNVGAEDGIRAFSWMKDGVTYVGTCGMTLKEAITKLKEGELHL